MSIKTPITIAYGDGIGPEIMRATLAILEAAGAEIDLDVIEVGEKIYRQGETSGIPKAAWESLKRTRVLLKGPITTPQGGGYKSLNVTLRKALGLYANVRPCVSYAPYVPTTCPNINLVIVRENEEDTYAGIEYRPTNNVFECLKIVTREGCEQVIRYAFEYALKFNRKKVTCFSKDNIMKMTDGLFHSVFNTIAKEYPNIEHEHYIVDIGTALIATKPELFDVIVTLNLYGDIISDVAAQVAGSVGLAGSANIGNHMAMFEAIHGSAPDIAGKGIANPSGLLNASVQMLIHINQPDVATRIENAWLCTIEDGIHTGDIYSKTYSKEKVGTDAFADAVITRLGKMPSHFKPVDYRSGAFTKIECYGEQLQHPTSKRLVGVDIYIDNEKLSTIEQLAKDLQSSEGLQLSSITSRGLKLWPKAHVETPYLRYLCCRFIAGEMNRFKDLSPADILALLQKFYQLQLSLTSVEHLYLYDNQPGFTLAQGE